MSQQPAAAMLEHQAISLLLPWHINGTLGSIDRQRVDSHVARCAICRADLELERQIHTQVAADVTVEHIPVASLNRLHARLDELKPAAGVRAPLRSSRSWLPWLGAVAASIAISVSIGFHLVHGTHPSGESASAAYYTVTDAEVRPAGEVIRAVFVPTITLVELQGLLEEAQLKIVSGPTEAGVYSLAARSTRPVGLSLALLRQHKTVRFAEITQERSAKSNVDAAP